MVLVHGVGTQQDYREFGDSAPNSGSWRRLIVEVDYSGGVKELLAEIIDPESSSG